MSGFSIFLIILFLGIPLCLCIYFAISNAKNGIKQKSEHKESEINKKSFDIEKVFLTPLAIDFEKKYGFPLSDIWFNSSLLLHKTLEATAFKTLDNDKINYNYSRYS